MSHSILSADLSFNTFIPTVKWPAIMDIDSARLLVMMDYVEQRSQWLPLEVLRAHQYMQLSALIHHARHSTPFYSAHFEGVPVFSSSEQLQDDWTSIPLVTLQDLTRAYRYFFSSHPLPDHGPIRSVTINALSIQILKNKAVDLMDNLLVLRDYLWQGREFKAAAARLFVADRSSHTTQSDWGRPFSGLVETGSMQLIAGNSSEEQAEALATGDPQYLMCTGDTWTNLLDYYRMSPPTHWSIRDIIIEDRMIDPAVRQLTETMLKTPVSDRYARPECGVIALRCPEFGQLHVQSEQVLLELLDEHGNACAEGELGYVTITTLHNFAFPLIRYRTEDRASFGAACGCKRTLPVLVVSSSY